MNTTESLIKACFYLFGSYTTFLMFFVMFQGNKQFVPYVLTMTTVFLAFAFIELALTILLGDTE